MGATPHLSCRQGKRVSVKMDDGTMHGGKFKERKGRYIWLEGGLKIQAGKVRSFVIKR